MAPNRYDACEAPWLDQEFQDILFDSVLTAEALTAPIYSQIEQDTGFHPPKGRRTLTALGQTSFPAVPADDENVTRNPHVTTLTELCALIDLLEHSPEVTVPHVRALHNAKPRLQHHGIDFVGFLREDGDEVVLLVEVMASIEDKVVPRTVTQHKEQLLVETVNELGSHRIIEDLNVVHREAQLRGEELAPIERALEAAHAGTLGRTIKVRGYPVLVRQLKSYGHGEWKPFKDDLDAFAGARVPCTIRFRTLVLPVRYAAAMQALASRHG